MTANPSVKIVQSNKRRTCYGCGKTIRIGDYYVRQVIFHPAGPVRLDTCRGCLGKA